MEYNQGQRVNDWLIPALKIVLGGTCLLLVLSFVASYIITGYHTYSTDYLKADELGLDARKFTLTGAQDTPLHGLFVPGDPRMPVLIASHGIADCKEGILPFMLPFARSGYGIVAYDLRHHNESGGRHCTLGYWEHDDLCALSAYVQTQLAPGRPIAYWGFSLGATVSLLATAQSNNVFAVIAHCPFASMRAVVSHYMRAFYHVPAWPIVPLTLKFFEWRTGARVAAVDVCAAAPRLRDVPVLVFGSDEDPQVPVVWLEQIVDAIGPTAELVVGPYGHMDGMIAEDEGLYDQRDIAMTLEFLERHRPRDVPGEPADARTDQAHAGAAPESSG